MSKTDISIGRLVQMIEDGELRLPEMQRRYVWRGTRVRDLLDSLYRGYPTGSILVWETPSEVPMRDIDVAQQRTPFSGRKLLLDGQQRLTSLSAVIRSEPVEVRGRKRPIDILFNLDHPEGPPVELVEVEGDEESSVLDEDEPDVPEDDENGDNTLLRRLNQRIFVVANKALLAQPNWIPVSDIFKTGGDWQLLRSRVVSPDDPRYERYSQRLQRVRKIKDYLYVMQVLDPELSYIEVAEIFVRVNSLGMKLRGSDLALAQITSRWQGSLRLFEEFQAECESNGFNLDLGLLVRTLVVFATQQCRFNTVGAIPLDHLIASWAKAKTGISYAINFLRTNARIENESLLSSPLFLIPIAVYSVNNKGIVTQESTNSLLYWLYVANARAHYSVSSESTLDADLNILFSQEAAPDQLLAPLMQRFGRLSIEPGDLVGRGQRSPLFSTAFLALKVRGATDWYSGLGLSLTHQGKLHYIQFHHIFPKSLLAEAGYEKGEINEIANMAFISSKANRAISNKDPQAYLAQIITQRGVAALESHCIPTAPQLQSIAEYRDFLTERRLRLVEAINALFEGARTGGHM